MLRMHQPAAAPPLSFASPHTHGSAHSLTTKDQSDVGPLSCRVIWRTRIRTITARPSLLPTSQAGTPIDTPRGESSLTREVYRVSTFPFRSMLGQGEDHFRKRSARFSGSQWAAASLLLAVATGLGLVTANRNRDFRDPEQLWRTVVEHLPRNWRAHNNLGLALLDRGAGDEALAAFRRAVQINPVFFQGNHSLGLELAKREELQDAATFIAAALRAQPGHRLAPQAHNDLGVVLASQGKLDEAADHYRQAVLLDPNFGAAHMNFGDALQRQGQLAQAEYMFRRAVELEPNNAAAHHGLGEILSVTERFDEALESFRAAALQAPDAAITWSRMAEAIILSHQQTGTGNLDEAISFAERAAALTEFGDPALLLTLADTYGASGEFGRAVDTLQDALAAAAVGPVEDELVTYLQERLAIYRTYDASPGRR